MVLYGNLIFRWLVGFSLGRFSLYSHGTIVRIASSDIRPPTFWARLYYRSVVLVSMHVNASGSLKRHVR